MSLVSWLKRRLKKRDEKKYISTRWDFERLFLQVGNLVVNSVPEGSDLPTDKSGQRKIKSPVSLVNKIIHPDLDLDFDNLDDKIKKTKKRLKSLKRKSISHSNCEKALVYLKARKKLKSKKGRELEEQLSSWKVTTNKKIEQLLEKYQVTMDDVTAYEDYIPEEALNEMDEYTTIFKKLTGGKEPRMSLIVYSKIAEAVKKKKDPIILAESCLGNFWVVLGAWDKEVELIPELLMEE